MTATSQHTARVELTVGQVAESFDVTVRTLHHYDAEGLVVPSARTPAGYRLYTDADLARLATVVTYRRLGLPLPEVRALLDGEGTPQEHLLRQRDAVVSRLAELQQLVTAIDRALERTMEQRPATTDELKELFGDGFSEEYQAEAKDRWGETDAWQQSARRTKSYTKADFEQIKGEADAVNAAFVAAMRSGAPATSAEAMDAAEEHRAHIERWFYDLDHGFHRGLADMYVADPRFTTTYEDIEPGLAAYVHDAIHANADRQGTGA
jgi:MerR family transcriptional regulator, thiopeptide resistance regulator